MSTTPTSSKQRRGVRVVSQPKVPLPPQLKRVNLDAAGIDIGAEEHWAIKTATGERWPTYSWMTRHC